MRINNPHRLRRLTLFFCLLLSCALWAGDSAATATATKLSAPGSASDGLIPERYSDPRGSLLSRITEAPSFLRAASPLRALLPFYTSLLTDDFNDNLRDASKWNLVTPGGAVPALEQNQRLEIKPLVNGAGSNYNGYTSTVGYDLTGARASVEVVQATGGTGGAETVLKITDSSSSANAGRFVVANGILFCQYKQAGSGYTTLAAPGYSPTQHRRWQLRHDAAADTLYWETSPDGASWTTLASVTDPFPVTSVLVTLTSGTWYEQAWPGEAIFDNFLMEPNQTNNPPAVALTTPAANTSFTAPATISIAANASDPDAGGSVTKVEFFAETMKLGEDTTAPFTFTWSNVAAGSYSLTAKATDNGGAQTTSAAVGITVALSPTTNPLADDFNDNAMDAAKWVLRTLGSGVTAAEQNQRLEITPVANAVGSNYNGYRTAAAYDLTGARASVEVVQATGGTGGAETGFNFNDSAGNSARFVVANGALFCQYKVAGQSANTTVSAPGYSPLQHRRWRLRHDQAADTLNWETSPDGASWATLGSVARPFPLTALQVTLTAGTWYEQASPGMAIFDNFLLEPNPANTPPSVALTAPAAGATFTAPASITLSAAATDADGGVAKVEFYSGTTLLGTVTSAPYNFTWNNVGAGSYGLTAKATDNSGAQTTTAAVGVTVSLPTVTITATDASASEQGPDAGTFTITRAGASGLTNSPLTVYFTAGGTATGGGTDYASIGTSVTIPVGATSQTVTITPVDDAVVENGGETVVLTLTANAAYTVGTPSSATVNIADNDTYPPTASITSPAGGTVFTVPASIEISAAASDSDGTVAKVEFYQGATKLGEDTTAPYSFTWNPAAGSYSLTARATDNAGATGTSAPVSVVVNTPPAVSVTGPADNTAVYAGTNVQLTASASDPDQGDAVAKVEFFQGTTKLGEDATAPYAFSWQNVPEGSYTLTAVATDGRGAQTTSAVVHVAAADFTAARLDPSNRTGSGGVDLYSRNFNWSLPVVALPGRAGLDLGLSLSYNSLVWTKSGGGVLFDGDGGWPAPGFRLGFPVVQGQFYDTQAQKTAYLLITPSGARVSLRQTAVPTVYEAGDSSYLQLTEETDGSLTLVMLGGARMTYRVHGAVYQCEKITDPNGNFITIAYDGYGRLDAVTDTLGRLVDFEYYPDGYLKEIKQTWHREVEGAAPVTETHYWARFEYVDVTLGINFPGLMPVGAQNGQAFHALRKVKLADDSSFVFDYTSWGQVSQVKAYAPDNRLLNYLKLNLPVDASQSQSDCPRPTELRSWAAYANGDADGAPAQAEELLTSYEVTDGATWTTPEDNQPQTGRLGRTTSPDGTVYKEYAPSAGWNRGLVRLNEIWSGGVKKKWTSTAWTQDDEALQYTQNPRVRETNVYDSNEDGSLHSRRRTEIVYTTFGLPQEVKEYDSNATTVLRRTVMTYVAASVNGVGAYATRRIIGLPSKREVYGLDDTSEKLYSKVTYEYDCGGEFLSAPEGSPASVAQHDDANFGTAFNTRGNPCRTRRWDADDRENLTKSVAAESGYNTLGSPVFNRDALGHQTSVTYADSDGGGRFAYPTTVTDPSGFTASAWYNYDLGVVMKTVTPTPQGTNGQPTVTRYYDAAGRPLKAAAGPSGTYTRWEYGASGLYVKVLTKVDTDKPETFVMSVTDGDGAAVGMLREHPGDGTGYAASRSEYDPVNRVVKRYNPVEVMVNAGDLSNARLWVPAGPDVTRLGRAGWPYSATEYDWKGRVRREVNPDGSDRLTDYNGCGCAGGEVVTTRGELVPTNAPSPAPAQGRRAQRVYHDILGRPQKTELLDWVGSVYSSTTTKYDALDRPVRVREYAGPAPAVEPEGEGGSYQTTAMSYDGHGRLHTRHLPIYDANTLVTYEYNNDDTGHSVTDPRGVKTTFTYNSRGMVTRVAYDPQLSGVPNTPDVTFDYDAAGNRIAMTDEAGSTSYQYDALSRLSSETRQFGGITQRTYTLTYAYTLA
ncbi:MAG: Ig-like domain-containing protein, partial [Pyrinomonadaceae bacterium]